MTRGIFFSFDGVDGAGKSTQMQLFGEWLTQQKLDFVTCRDPGSTPLGEEIRNLVLRRDGCAIGKHSELLLYMAARAQLVEEVIQPALELGKIIVSDRFLLANVAYQAYAGGLDVEQAWDIGQFATSGVAPDLTFVLDLPVDVAWSRINRERDRMEQRGPEFLERVRQGFLTEAARQRSRTLLVDASQTIEEIQSKVRLGAERVLQL
jgi:dTMP kinase